MNDEYEKMSLDFQGTQYTMDGNATMIWLKAFDIYLEKEEKELNIQKPKK
jgi:hypothetical protein